MGYFTELNRAIYPKVPLLPPDGGFSLTNAGTLIWAAQLTYEMGVPNNFPAVLDDWKWKLVGRFDKPASGIVPLSAAKGYVAQAGAATIVAFAGTEPESFPTWLGNLNMRPAGNGAHSGFSGAAKAAEPDVVAALGRTTGPIYLTGHSLGAALAAIMAMRLADGPFRERIQGVYTIGMPRPGDAEYAANYNARLGARTFRLVHGEDLVTKVPPYLLGSRHVGALLACQRGGRFIGLPVQPADEGNALAESTEILATIGLPLRGNDAPPYPAARPAAATAVAHLSPPIRDHLPDGSLRALGALA